MTQTKRNNAEGGTSGTAVTTTNSGGASGDAWNVISGGTAIFDSASAMDGSMGYKLTPTSGQICILRHTGFTGKTGAAQVNLTIDTMPGANEGLLTVRTSTDALVIDAGLRFDNTYAIRNSAGSVMQHTTATYLAGDKITLSWTVGTTTSNGTWSFSLYRSGSGTALETKTGTVDNLGTADWAYVQYGKSSADTWVGVVHIDGMAATDTGTTIPSANTAPTANAGVDQTVEPWSTVTLDGSGSSDSDGTVASYAWSQTSGTTVTLSSSTAQKPTFTAPASSSDATLVFSLTVTDDGGATSTADTVSITVLAATEFFLDGTGTWKPMRIVAL